MPLRGEPFLGVARGERIYVCVSYVRIYSFVERERGDVCGDSVGLFVYFWTEILCRAREYIYIYIYIYVGGRERETSGRLMWRIRANANKSSRRALMLCGSWSCFLGFKYN